jgi:NAD(P)-dependent dehydrogenase (short-subunit alcohol dehydrogenase family)
MSQQTRVRGTAGQWTEADVPDQSGRTAVITGGNSGIGFEAARVLAGRGARLILGCRDRGKAHDAVTRIRAAAPGADVRVVPLDLASLDSVKAAAGQIRSACEGIDLVVNNAGVMMPPYGRTTDGFELQFGINQIRPFRADWLLIDWLARCPGAVVTVSSNGHWQINLTTFSPSAVTGGRPGMASQAQPDVHLRTQRLHSARIPAIAVAAHPCLTRTDLARYLSRVMSAYYVLVERPFAQRAAIGALGTLRAATDPAVRGGDYYGPGRWRGERGYPVRASSSERSHDEGAQRRLWQESERLTGVRYAI